MSTTTPRRPDKGRPTPRGGDQGTAYRPRTAADHLPRPPRQERSVGAGVLSLLGMLLLVVGAFIDAVSALYLFVPIVAPVLLEVGVDVTTIGVMMVVNLALGLITPPVGINLFVAAGIAKVSLVEVVRGIRPFFVAGLAVILLVAYVPAIPNWLPDLLGF